MCVQQVWLGDERRHSTIVSVVFGRGGLVVGKICRVDLIGMGEKIPLLGKIPNIDCGNLMHLLELSSVSCNFLRVG